jgi:iron(III) transport system substrate-binding protein
MKAFVKFLTLCLVVSFVVSCGPAATTQPPAATLPPSTNPTTAPTTGPSLSANEQWAKDNGLGSYQPTTLDWAAIEAAAKLEGSVMVYANSSKFEKILDAWNALYPDIKLDGGDTDGITTKMQAEQEAGNVVGDVWFNSDGHILYGLFAPNQWIWSFVPDGYANPAVTAERPFAVQRHSVDVWAYNQEIHPDGCPISNWWALVDPALRGKVFMENPLADPSTTAKFTLIIDHADEMATAYQAFYGKDWTTDEAMAPDGYGVVPENAGYLFLRKLARNGPVMEPGGDEVDTAYASLGMDKAVEPGYGLTGWDSYKTTLDGEIAMAPCLTMKPVIGILKSNYVAIANMSKHPNAAKLFIKFILSQDGFKAWNNVGTFPGNFNNTAWDGAPAINSISVWPSDDTFAWANNSKVRDFFATEMFTAP